MADENEIDVRVVAQTDSLDSGMQSAAGSVAQSARAMQMSMAELAGSYSKLEAEARSWQASSVSASNAAGAAVRKASVDFKALIEASTGVGREMKYAQESANTFKDAFLGLDASGPARKMLQLGEAVESAGSKMRVGATGMREIVVLGHELMSGNWSRIPGSITVLASRMGGLGTVANMLTPAFLGWSAVAVASIAAVSVAAYELIEHINALNQTMDRMAMTGASFDEARSHAQALQDTLTNEFDETQGTARRLITELNKLPASMLSSQQAAAELGEELGAMQHTDAASGIKEVVNAMKGGPEAFLRWAHEMFGLENATTASGESLDQFVKEAIALNDPGSAASAIFKAIADQAGNSAKKLVDAKNAMQDFAIAAGYMALGGVSPDATGLPVPQIPKETAAGYKKNLPDTREPPEIQAGIATANKAVEAETRKKTLQDQLNQLKQTEAALEGQIEGTLMAGNNAESQKLQTQIAINKEAQKNIEIELQKAHTPGEEQDFQRQMAGLQGQEQAARNNSQAIIRIKQEEAAATAKYYGSGSAEAIRANNAVAAAQRAADQQALTDKISAIDDQIAAVKRGSQQEIELIKQKQALIAQYEGTLTSPTQARGASRELANAQREASDQAYQKFSADERLKVQEAKNDVSQIIQIYNEWAAKAAATYGQDSAEFKKVQQDKVRAVQQAYSQAYSQANQAISGLTTIYRLDQSAFERNEKAKVASKQITNQQALAADQQYAEQHYEIIRQMLQQELQAGNLTVQQRTEINIKLMELDEEYAEKHASINEQIAQADKAQLEKQLKDYKSFFDSVGNQFENYVEAAVMHTSTFRDATRSLLTGIGKDTFKLVFDQLSQKGAQMLGAKSGEGIGDLLSNWVGKQLGIKKPEDKQQTQTTAITQNTSAVKDLTGVFKAAVSNLGKQLAKPGTPGSGPAGSAATSDYSATTSGGYTYSNQDALALIEKYESNGKNVKNPTSTASGYYQITNPTWQDVQKAVPAAGQYPTAMSAPQNVQQQGASYLYQTRGFQPWTIGDKPLANAINQGEGATSGPQTTQAVAQGVTQAAPQLGQTVGQQVQTANTQLSTAIQSDSSTVNQNSSDLKQNTSQLQNNTNQQKSGGGGGASGPGLGASFTQLTGALGKFVPGLSTLTSAFQTAQTIQGALSSIMGLNTIATTTNTAATVTESAAATLDATLPKPFGFSHGGIMPSAAGGMLLGGGSSGGSLALLHPKEMVLPANLSQGVQQAINQSGSLGQGSGRGNPATNFTYAPTLNGGSPFMTRGQAEGFFRSHGDAMMGYVRNAVRNGMRM